MPADATERWRPVVGYEGVYAVSDHGRVLRVARGRGARLDRPRRAERTRLGYLRITLTWLGVSRRFLVHVLVARAFLGRAGPGQEVNHLDGDKANNRAANLEYQTHAGNIRHALATGLVERPVGDANALTRYSAAIKAEWRRRHLAGETTHAIARDVGASQEVVWRAVRGSRRVRHRAT